MNENNKNSSITAGNLGLIFGAINALAGTFCNPVDKTGQVKSLLEIAKLNDIKVTEEFFDKVINIVFEKSNNNLAIDDIMKNINKTLKITDKSEEEDEG